MYVSYSITWAPLTDWPLFVTLKPKEEGVNQNQKNSCGRQQRPRPSGRPGLIKILPLIVRCKSNRAGSPGLRRLCFGEIIHTQLFSGTVRDAWTIIFSTAVRRELFFAKKKKSCQHKYLKSRQSFSRNYALSAPHKYTVLLIWIPKVPPHQMT